MNEYGIGVNIGSTSTAAGHAQPTHADDVAARFHHTLQSPVKELQEHSLAHTSGFIRANLPHDRLQSKGL